MEELNKWHEWSKREVIDLAKAKRRSLMQEEMLWDMLLKYLRETDDSEE